MNTKTCNFLLVLAVLTLVSACQAANPGYTPPDATSASPTVTSAPTATLKPAPTTPPVIANWRIMGEWSKGYQGCGAFADDTEKILYTQEKPVIAMGAGTVSVEITDNLYWVSIYRYKLERPLNELALTVETRIGPRIIIAMDCNIVVDAGPFILTVR